MRDKRCKKEIIEKEINEEIENINSDFEYIKKLQSGQIYKTNLSHKEILNNFYRTVINSKLNIMRCKYTLGIDLSELYKEYLIILKQVNKMSGNIYNYLSTSIVIFGILFEDGIENFPKLINLMDTYKEHDILFDYLINGCGLKRNFHSEVFAFKWFEFSTELIEIAQKDKVQASKQLVDYMNNQFYKDFWGKDWESSIDFDYYTGSWMFGYAAIVKMFKLDDSKLKDHPHYPYELAHYKNEMEFNMF